MAVGRGVYQRWFNASHASKWWPSQDYVGGGQDGAQTREHSHPENRSLAGDHEAQSICMEDQEMSKAIYILGAGNLGSFAAHSLAGIPRPPPITMLLKRRQLQHFLDHDSSIDVTTRGVTETRRGFQIEVLLPHARNPPAQELDRSIDITQSIAAGPEQDRLPSSSSSDLKSAYIHERHQPPDALERRDSIVENDSQPIDQTNASSRSRGNPDIEFTVKENEGYTSWLTQMETTERQSKLENETDTPKLEAVEDAEEGNNIILHLIVSVKAPQTIRALESLSHRLSRDSTILFLQNGMGIIDEVNAKLFPDEKYRPNYIIGVVSHGLYSTRSFSVNHAGEGTIALGAMPRLPIKNPVQPEELAQLATSSRYLLRTMTRTPVFVAVGIPPTDILQQQLDKLAVNCIINPLTAIFDCHNGALITNFYFTRVIRLLLAEIALVINNLPELKNVPNVKMRFDTLRLERLVFSIAGSTAGNRSSMLQDLRSGKQTEIDYINGYIIKRGEEMGIHCVMNYMLVHMIKGKRKIWQDNSDLLPFAEPT